MQGGSLLLGLASRALLRDPLSHPLDTQAVSPRCSPCCVLRDVNSISPRFPKGSSLKIRNMRLTCLWVGKGVGQLQSPDAHLMPLSFLLSLARPFLAHGANSVRSRGGQVPSLISKRLWILLLCGRILTVGEKGGLCKNTIFDFFFLLGKCVPDSNTELHWESRGGA